MMNVVCEMVYKATEKHMQLHPTAELTDFTVLFDMSIKRLYIARNLQIFATVDVKPDGKTTSIFYTMIDPKTIF